MKNLEQYVGRKVKGVRFENNVYNGMGYPDSMIEFEGREGVITSYDGDIVAFKVNFTSPREDYWYYPVKVILSQLEEELVGYLVEDSKYAKIIAGLVNCSVETLLKKTEEGVHFIPNSYIGEVVTKYDLLDKCTPVYKPVEVKLPKINGYDGEDKGDYLQYGCAKISKKWFEETENRYITYLELNSHVRINSKQMEVIREYLKFNK